ncbi:hypothetical protein P171DRAFT_183901 [Karstenula rhodostoma CBS 690.94]|uniref:Uncharacterized protein n=1 Tax=Karstenula rhodostoma CBS 690.94 TaxID=1392251 RepID=A0A9P4U3U8_9PLEO|nr:hypothetical protein P171DRAFT_183901 [Karstenula rhodostoma CBS 690.94]
MVYHSPLQDVPALAFSSDSATPSPCRLSIKFSKAHNQASILLSFCAHVHDFADEQQVVLIYDADQLVPGTSFLRPTTEDLSQAQQSRLARSGSPAFKTLQLTLRQPCPVRCLPSTGCIAPKTGHETQLHQLRDLARALDICLVFDHVHLHVNQYAAFHHLVNRPESLVGVPYRGALTRETDWTVFVPLEDVVADSLPPYSEVSAKRYREAGGSSSPELLPLKRKRAVPAVPTRINTAIPAAFDLLLGSPTEKATTTALPSPLRSSSPYKPAHVHDVIENALNTMVPLAVEKVSAGRS